MTTWFSPAPLPLVPIRCSQILDADDKALVNRQGVKAARDLVQFVTFSEHRNNGPALARELLEELPGQFLQWVR